MASRAAISVAAAQHKTEAQAARAAMMTAAQMQSARTAAAAKTRVDVHVAAVAAAVATAAAEGFQNRPEVAASAAVRAATAVNNAVALEAGAGMAGVPVQLCTHVSAEACSGCEMTEMTCFCRYTARRRDRIAPGASLKSSDIVLVTFTCVGRHALATSSRTWRKVGLEAV